MDTKRLVIKIAGESGQGVNSIGEIVARALKGSGFFTFGYREYPSLIRGGHAFHQIDFAGNAIYSPSRESDVLVCLSRLSFHVYLSSLKAGGQVIHMLSALALTEEEQKLVDEKNIKITYLAAEKLAQEVGGKAIMANVVLIGALWKLLDLPIEPLSSVIYDQFVKKPEVIEPNIACLKKGYASSLDTLTKLKINFATDSKRSFDALLSGNNLISLGAVAAGVRAYFAYPMTPSSSILSYMANIYHDTGILVKQFDDEISVAQSAIGAAFMGTRALVATSGGGFDLMTESVSLAGMTETPFVCVVAQRPGPATGLPTWTAQSDLNLAVYGAHGEFPRCVLAAGDPKSAYLVIQNAFNIAEKYQMPVIVLTDKEIAESLFQVEDLENGTPIERHLVGEDELKSIVASDRYKLTENGISPRWLPGSSDETYVANSDEHLGDGTITEDAESSRLMYLKRLKKMETLLAALPEPKIFGPAEASLTLLGWGSIKNTVCDVLDLWNDKHADRAVNYLHYEYIYPLRVEKINELIVQKQPIVLVENNALGQLGMLLSAHTGYQFEDRFLKFDGRPFFVEDLFEYLGGRLDKK